MCCLDGVGQTFNGVTHPRLEKQRPPSVERELMCDREAPRAWVLEGGDLGRQGAQLSLAATDRVATQRRLSRAAPRRPDGIGESAVERGGDPAPDPGPPEAVGSEPMGRGGRWMNPGCKIGVEGRCTYDRNEPWEDSAPG